MLLVDKFPNLTPKDDLYATTLRKNVLIKDRSW